MTALAKLHELYMQESKHSSYQILPRSLRSYFDGYPIRTQSRYEEQRLSFIKQNIDFVNKNILDIGGNTGFFTFEMLDAGAAHATCYEGNPAHADFVRLSASILNVCDRLTVINKYLDTPGFSFDQRYDITLLMNVLHHLGDDYMNDPALDTKSVRELIRESLQKMAQFTQYLVFQMGYCWKGNREIPIFHNGTKSEQIAFVESAIEGCWEVFAIGVPEDRLGEVVYSAPSEENMIRRDDMGEFLNRPLFILKTLM